MEGLSSKQRMRAALWMREYAKVMARPQRGAITYGGGLNLTAWMIDAEAEGFHVCLTPECVVLREKL